MGGRPARSLSRARSGRGGATFSVKEKLSPHAWEAKDVEQWLKDIEIGEENLKLLEGLNGKELLQLTPEAFQQRGIQPGIVLTGLNKGIKLLLTGTVPRTPRQVKHYPNWNEKDVIGWFVEIGLGPMVSQATEQGLKGSDLSMLDISKVKELGGDDASLNLIKKKLKLMDTDWGVGKDE
uniref:SAM domain-containing protein n=1 Tax=Paramoeba aestuarina TaxID=180227 RepID=A0A7S4JQR7_9EUKA|mmetsp:Transcript_1227/g.1949  ORF Transcript_1227/g.1949 Transcript_1227/m.1949 type:complete len:179 (+) Transcript_1227:264-800(+)